MPRPGRTRGLPRKALEPWPGSLRRQTGAPVIGRPEGALVRAARLQVASSGKSGSPWGRGCRPSPSQTGLVPEVLPVCTHIPCLSLPGVVCNPACPSFLRPSHRSLAVSCPTRAPGTPGLS